MDAAKTSLTPANLLVLGLVILMELGRGAFVLLVLNPYILQLQNQGEWEQADGWAELGSALLLSVGLSVLVLTMFGRTATPRWSYGVPELKTAALLMLVLSVVTLVLPPGVERCAFSLALSAATLVVALGSLVLLRRCGVRI